MVIQLDSRSLVWFIDLDNFAAYQARIATNCGSQFTLWERTGGVASRSVGHC